MIKLSNQLFFAQVEEMLREGHEVQLRVKGYSMRPLLRNERDIVVLAPYHPGEELHCGDIVLFRYHGRHVLHRIVHIDATQLTLAGDGNYRVWEHCQPNDVAGIVRRVIRPNGREISCKSPQWLRMSRAWLKCPPIVRRIVLAILFRLGYR